MRAPSLIGATIVASVSSGKDSAAMCLHLRDLGLTGVRYVFADTGWEHPDTYTYLRGELTRVLGPIEEVIGRDGGMEALIRRKAMFPSRLRRFCTEELKQKPIRKRIQELQDAAPAGTEVINAIGIRREESDARVDALEWEWSDFFDCWVWRPIVTWTFQQVVDIHHRHGLAPNPLYLRGAERVGCWPCIFARKKEIRMVAQESPERIEQIARLEAELTEKASAPRTYFHGRTHRDGRPMPIGRVVSWSGTAHGTLDQGVLFHDLGQPEGCARWGLCEAAKGEDEE